MSQTDGNGLPDTASNCGHKVQGQALGVAAHRGRVLVPSPLEGAAGNCAHIIHIGHLAWVLGSTPSLGVFREYMNQQMGSQLLT